MKKTLKYVIIKVEELAVTLSVGDAFMDVVHEYPDLTVHLTLFNATIAEGEPQMLEHNDIAEAAEEAKLQPRSLLSLVILMSRSLAASSIGNMRLSKNKTSEGRKL